jgi:hypothetical protein
MLFDVDPHRDAGCILILTENLDRGLVSGAGESTLPPCSPCHGDSAGMFAGSLRVLTTTLPLDSYVFGMMAINVASNIGRDIKITNFFLLHRIPMSSVSLWGHKLPNSESTFNNTDQRHIYYTCSTCLTS